MDKRQLFDTFEKVAQGAEKTAKDVQTLRSAVDNLLQRNAELEMENQHLRARLQELQGASDETMNAENAATTLSASRQNLEKIYEEGFHVCNMAYGSRRANDEDCAFCLDVIYGERK